MSTFEFEPPVRRKRLSAVRELIGIVVMFLLYRQVRYLTRNDTGTALSNARRVVGLERRLGVFTERLVQDTVMHCEWFVGLLNRYYVTVHFPLTAAFVVWALFRHPRWFPTLRTWFFTVTGAALLLHVAFPLAPPRMLADEGFVDTLRRFGPNIYPANPNQSMANQFAAMPSLHFGWALMVAVAFVAIKRTRWSLLAFLHPSITLLAIVATANHYWLDAAVAGALAVAFAAVIVIVVPAFSAGARDDLDDRRGMLVTPWTRSPVGTTSTSLPARQPVLSSDCSS
jgi:hypothetical protein